MTTRSPPGIPSADVNPRPSASGTPSVWRNSGDTESPRTRSGSARPVTVQESFSKRLTASKTRLSSLYVKYNEGAMFISLMPIPGAVCSSATRRSECG